MHKTNRLKIVRELRGASYRDFLVALSPLASTGSLVVRKQFSAEYQERMAELIEPLKSTIIRRSEVAEWPGTSLVDSSAELIEFGVGPNSIEFLGNTAAGLYSWVYPNLPEDLCLLRPNKEPILVSISHEKNAYLVMDREEQAQLLRAVPSLVGRLQIEE